MAALTPFSVAVWALLPPLAAACGAALRGTMATRLVAAQLASAITTILLVLMSFAFDQDAYIDLALTLAVLNVPGTLIVAATMERWL